MDGRFTFEGRSTTKSTAASVLQFMISLTKSDAGRWLKIGPTWELGNWDLGFGTRLDRVRLKDKERGASSPSHKIFMAAALLLREPRLHFTHSLKEGKLRIDRAIESREEFGEIFHSIATFQKLHPHAASLITRKGGAPTHPLSQSVAHLDLMRCNVVKKGQTKCNSGVGGGGIHFSSVA